jgi:protease-4
VKKKQVIGVIIASAAIILTGILGLVGNVIANNFMHNPTNNEDSGTSIFSSLFGPASDDISLPLEDFVGVINVVGEIGPSAEDSIWSQNTGYDHDLNMNYIDEMMTAENNKGILIYVDSPGGTVYESDELYLKLMQYKETTGRPIWAYFASEACSGGYYISMAADKIYANRNCSTGSIGVIISAINTQGLYEKIGLETVNITSGENKAMEFKPEQLAIYQGIVDEAYDQFVDIVCKGRHLDDNAVRKLADGRIYTAKQALDNKLIDNICTYEDFMKELFKEWQLNSNVTCYDPQEDSNQPFGELFAAISNLIPKSEAQIGKEILNSYRNGVPMYYAQ